MIAKQGEKTDGKHDGRKEEKDNVEVGQVAILVGHTLKTHADNDKVHFIKMYNSNKM
jgi:hypothetical protein